MNPNPEIKNHVKSGYSKYHHFILAADVGGTHSNFAVFGVKRKTKQTTASSFQPQLLYSLHFDSRQLHSIIPALDFVLAYSNKFGIRLKAWKACIAAAGPISRNGAYCQLTNTSWAIDLNDVKRKIKFSKFNFSKVVLINDFQAAGYAVNVIGNKSMIALRRAKTNSHSTTHSTTHSTKAMNAVKAVIGAGSGLGKSILIYDKIKNCHVPLASEGGHADLPISSSSQLELQLADFIMAKKRMKYKNNEKSSSSLQPSLLSLSSLSSLSSSSSSSSLSSSATSASLSFLSYEDVLSGRGIELLYEFFTRKSGRKFFSSRASERASEILKSKENERAALISKYRTTDRACAEAFRLFVVFYARCAKNFALECLPTGGLYIAGGIAAKNKDIFSRQNSQFLAEFEKAPEPYNNILKSIPLFVITDYNAGLYGACFAANIAQ